MAERVGFVYVQNQYAGKIVETDEGYRFSYDKPYMMDPCSLPVSLTMPLAKESYESNVLFPFFDGLIPEGWLLYLVSHNWKLDTSDRFGLLLSACKDCVGDVQVLDERGE